MFSTIIFLSIDTVCNDPEASPSNCIKELPRLPLYLAFITAFCALNSSIVANAVFIVGFEATKAAVATTEPEITVKKGKLAQALGIALICLLTVATLLIFAFLVFIYTRAKDAANHGGNDIELNAMSTHPEPRNDSGVEIPPPPPYRNPSSQTSDLPNLQTLPTIHVQHVEEINEDPFKDPQVEDPFRDPPPRDDERGVETGEELDLPELRHPVKAWRRLV
jgi:hypothetical protein